MLVFPFSSSVTLKATQEIRCVVPTCNLINNNHNLVLLGNKRGTQFSLLVIVYEETLLLLFNRNPNFHVIQRNC